MKRISWRTPAGVANTSASGMVLGGVEHAPTAKANRPLSNSLHALRVNDGLIALCMDFL
jgi:hypothetical protein